MEPNANRGGEQVDVFQNVYVSCPEEAADLYASVFGFMPLLGLTKFHNAEWVESELTLPNEQGSLTLRFVNSAKANGFAADTCLLLVASDVADILHRAEAHGFVLHGDIEVIDSTLWIGRMSDPDGNRVIVANRAAWKRTGSF